VQNLQFASLAFWKNNNWPHTLSLHAADPLYTIQTIQNSRLMKNTIVFILLITTTSLVNSQVQTNTNRLRLVKEVSLEQFSNESFIFQAVAKYLPTDSTGQSNFFLLQVGKGDYDFIKGSGQWEEICSNDSDWAYYSIEGEVKPGAKRIWIYLNSEGNGDCYFDNLSFKIKKSENKWTNNLIKKGDFEDVSDPIKIFVNKKSIEVNEDNQVNIINNNESDYGKSLHVSIKNNQQFLQYRCGYDKNKGNFIECNNIDIYYETYGKGEPLLLLHGNGQSISSFSEQIPEYSKHFKVIAVDTRGQGKSTDTISERFSYNQFAEDMKVLLDSLNLRQVNIVGWSDGGNTGITLAMNYPQYVKSLVTMGANLNASDTSICSKVIKETHKDILKLKSKSGNYDKTTVKLLEMLLSEPNITLSELKNIDARTLVIAGEKDVILEQHTKLIANSIPNAKIKIVEDETHFLPIENPERFNKIVLDFLMK